MADSTTDPIATTEEEQYIREEGEYIQVQKNVEIISDTGARKNRFVDYTNCWAWLQPLSGADIIKYEKRDINVTGKVFVAVDLDVSEGDILIFAAKTMRVQSKVNQAGKSSLYRIDVSEKI